MVACHLQWCEICTRYQRLIMDTQRNVCQTRQSLTVEHNNLKTQVNQRRAQPCCFLAFSQVTVESILTSFGIPANS